jgi:magnesium chelatase accessory protein
MSLAIAMAADALSPPTEAWHEASVGWPHRESSRFVRADGLLWHVQMMGRGPVLLLLHGTGASTHSWRGLMPLLAERFTVIAPDLPGLGFTSEARGPQLSLAGMAAGVAALLAALGLTPSVIVGHSAGAAVGARLCLDGAAPSHFISLNGALLPLNGWAGTWFSPIARTLVALPGVAQLFAWSAADRSLIERLLRDTGSSLDEEGVDYYARLFRRPAHVGATLGMMAAWDLPGLAQDLPGLATPTLLVVGQQDRTIRPTEARRIQAILPSSRVVKLPGLGHLAHEEAPKAVARAILETPL